jgi:predicted dehydrogenase
MNRRIFLMGTGAAGGAVYAADRVKVGLIGSGGRGQFLAGEFKEIGAEVAAVCDVYEPNLRAGLKAASSGAKSYGDYRRLLEDKTLEAVIVATPDHWHAKMVIDAVNAGKDVYVEKPLCHTVEEGFAMVAAVRRTKRVCQVGTQRRSAAMFQKLHGLVQSGRLGDVRLVTSWWLNSRDGLSHATFQGPIDWTMWLGSAPKRAPDPLRFYNWYYFWDYSGGLLIGQAAHIVDTIQWFMGSKMPLAVTCAGGRVNLQGAEVPETASISLEYRENYLAVFTLGYKAMQYAMHNDQLMQFHGSRARLDVGRENYAVFPENQALVMKPESSEDLPGSFARTTRDHIRNFLECIQTRRDPNAPIEGGLATAVALCMTVEALRKGRRIRWNVTAGMMEG